MVNHRREKNNDVVVSMHICIYLKFKAEIFGYFDLHKNSVMYDILNHIKIYKNLRLI